MGKRTVKDAVNGDVEVVVSNSGQMFHVVAFPRSAFIPISKSVDGPSQVRKSQGKPKKKD